VNPAALALALAGALQQPPSFAAQVETVYVDVFVTDRGATVTGLGSQDFELRDNGVRQGVELVALETMPLDTLLVLDSSQSLEGERLRQLQLAARLLVAGLRPEDAAGLLTFDHELRLRVPLTTDRATLETGLQQMKGEGSTALYDAVYAGLRLATGRRRALLVVFTDGLDNLSVLDQAQVQATAEASNVLVQAVGIEPADRPGSLRGLARIAEITGGRFWPAESPAQLGPAFLALLEAMKTRYVLRYEPTGVKREGRHRLEVRLRGRRGEVHARAGYFVAAPLH
jgi:VWFA-related protein